MVILASYQRKVIKSRRGARPVRGYNMYYVYVLQSKRDHQFYTGYTADLQKRISEHNTGKSFHTSKHRPYELVYYEASHNKYDALAREKYLKSGMGKRYPKNRNKRFLSENEKGL